MDRIVKAALKKLEAEGYLVLEAPRFRCPWPGAPTLCAVLRSPTGEEEVATFSTVPSANPLLGIYPRELTNL